MDDRRNIAGCSRRTDRCRYRLFHCRGHIAAEQEGMRGRQGGVRMKEFARSQEFQRLIGIRDGADKIAQ
jgi:hypothetical protein